MSCTVLTSITTTTTSQKGHEINFQGNFRQSLLVLHCSVTWIVNLVEAELIWCRRLTKLLWWHYIIDITTLKIACMPSIFNKTPQIFFDESCVISAFTKFFFEKLRMIEIGPRGRWKRSSIFQVSHPSKKSMLQKLTNKRKRRRFGSRFAL